MAELITTPSCVHIFHFQMHEPSTHKRTGFFSFVVHRTHLYSRQPIQTQFRNEKKKNVISILYGGMEILFNMPVHHTGLGHPTHSNAIQPVTIIIRQELSISIQMKGRRLGLVYRIKGKLKFRAWFIAISFVYASRVCSCVRCLPFQTYSVCVFNSQNTMRTRARGRRSTYAAYGRMVSGTQIQILYAYTCVQRLVNRKLDILMASVCIGD